MSFANYALYVLCDVNKHVFRNQNSVQLSLTTSCLLNESF